MPRAKLSSIIDRPIRILETGEGYLGVHDASTDEMLGKLVLTMKGAPELYDRDENFFEDDTD